MFTPRFGSTVYSGYSGHVYSGHSDIVATFPDTKYIYYIICQVYICLPRDLEVQCTPDIVATFIVASRI